MNGSYSSPVGCNVTTAATSPQARSRFNGLPPLPLPPLPPSDASTSNTVRLNSGPCHDTHTTHTNPNRPHTSINSKTASVGINAAARTSDDNPPAPGTRHQLLHHQPGTATCAAEDSGRGRQGCFPSSSSLSSVSSVMNLDVMSATTNTNGVQPVPSGNNSGNAGNGDIDHSISARRPGRKAGKKGVQGGDKDKRGGPGVGVGVGEVGVGASRTSGNNEVPANSTSRNNIFKNMKFKKNTVKDGLSANVQNGAVPILPSPNPPSSVAPVATSIIPTPAPATSVAPAPNAPTTPITPTTPNTLIVPIAPIAPINTTAPKGRTAAAKKNQVPEPDGKKEKSTARRQPMTKMKDGAIPVPARGSKPGEDAKAREGASTSVTAKTTKGTTGRKAAKTNGADGKEKDKPVRSGKSARSARSPSPAPSVLSVSSASDHGEGSGKPSFYWGGGNSKKKRGGQAANNGKAGQSGPVAAGGGKAAATSWSVAQEQKAAALKKIRFSKKVKSEDMEVDVGGGMEPSPTSPTTFGGAGVGEQNDSQVDPKPPGIVKLEEPEGVQWTWGGDFDQIPGLGSARSNSPPFRPGVPAADSMASIVSKNSDATIWEIWDSGDEIPGLGSSTIISTRSTSPVLGGLGRSAGVNVVIAGQTPQIPAVSRPVLAPTTCFGDDDDLDEDLYGPGVKGKGKAVEAAVDNTRVDDLSFLDDGKTGKAETRDADGIKVKEEMIEQQLTELSLDTPKPSARRSLRSSTRGKAKAVQAVQSEAQGPSQNTPPAPKRRGRPPRKKENAKEKGKQKEKAGAYQGDDHGRGDPVPIPIPTAPPGASQPAVDIDMRMDSVNHVVDAVTDGNTDAQSQSLPASVSKSAAMRMFRRFNQGQTSIGTSNGVVPGERDVQTPVQSEEEGKLKAGELVSTPSMLIPQLLALGLSASTAAPESGEREEIGSTNVNYGVGTAAAAPSTVLESAPKLTITLKRGARGGKAKAATGVEDPVADQVPVVKKRGPGRPPRKAKEKEAAAQVQAEGEAAGPSTVVKRRPGRPPKGKQKEVAIESAIIRIKQEDDLEMGGLSSPSDKPPARRLRPRLSAAAGPSTATPKTRGGRKKKSETTEVEEGALNRASLSLPVPSIPSVSAPVPGPSTSNPATEIASRKRREKGEGQGVDAVGDVPQPEETPRKRRKVKIEEEETEIEKKVVKRGGRKKKVDAAVVNGSEEAEATEVAGMLVEVKEKTSNRGRKRRAPVDEKETVVKKRKTVKLEVVDGELDPVRSRRVAKSTVKWTLVKDKNAAGRKTRQKKKKIQDAEQEDGVEPDRILRPSIWAGNETELLFVLPELSGSKCFNGIAEGSSNFPMVFLDESTVDGVGIEVTWLRDENVFKEAAMAKLTLTRDFVCPSDELAGGEPVAVDNVMSGSVDAGSGASASRATNVSTIGLPSASHTDCPPQLSISTGLPGPSLITEPSVAPKIATLDEVSLPVPPSILQDQEDYDLDSELEYIDEDISSLSLVYPPTLDSPKEDISSLSLVYPRDPPKEDGVLATQTPQLPVTLTTESISQNTIPNTAIPLQVSNTTSTSLSAPSFHYSFSPVFHDTPPAPTPSISLRPVHHWTNLAPQPELVGKTDSTTQVQIPIDESSISKGPQPANSVALMPHILPPEIEILSTSYKLNLPLILIASREIFNQHFWAPADSLEGASEQKERIGLATEHAYVFLGFFRIVKKAKRKISRDILKVGLGFVSGRIEWTFEVEWMPGYDGRKRSDELGSRYPWWAPGFVFDKFKEGEEPCEFSQRIEKLKSQPRLNMLPMQLMDGQEVGSPDEAMPRGWLCKICGRLNQKVMMRHRWCPSSTCRDNPLGRGYAVVLESAREPNQIPLTLPINTCNQTRVEVRLADWDDGMKTLKYRPVGGGRGLLKHIFTCNIMDLQREATPLFEKIQEEVCLMKKAGDSGPLYRCHVSDLYLNKTLRHAFSCLSWSEAPHAVKDAQDRMMFMGKNYGEEEILNIDQMTIIGWVSCGSRKTPETLPAKERTITMLCLGNDVILTIVPKWEVSVQNSTSILATTPSQQVLPNPFLPPNQNVLLPVTSAPANTHSNPDFDALIPIDTKEDVLSTPTRRTKTSRAARTPRTPKTQKNRNTRLPVSPTTSGSANVFGAVNGAPNSAHKDFSAAHAAAASIVPAPDPIQDMPQGDPSLPINAPVSAPVTDSVSGITGINGTSGVNEGDSAGAGASGNRKPKPRGRQKTKDKSIEDTISVTLVHGDMLLFSGCDFEYSIKRTGTSILLLGSKA